MGLNSHWSGAYLEHKQNEHSSGMFINQPQTIYKNCTWINPMVIGSPWANAYI